ncbi:DUF58 domain-containing protein [Clostridium fallax]|uniref:Uncharacterized conserved protein, DUF58 family, contains vWF domain n=1 Tax=Clostridium fallax TaxID=1533 RepID=A0A1M4VMS4_9CLOT|nr:DUF58 domain-containing protein [Clostridium fallax]SHE70299.1 Uncharacterized conserved protein, DUF58 family, contains vWF domain [Clostridium fallax]SQB22802.1 Uncharacterized conserved protein (some members contain a von Willebrand factor type A (vWA) domain) [Clostridium fallax]
MTFIVVIVSLVLCLIIGEKYSEKAFNSLIIKRVVNKNKIFPGENIEITMTLENNKIIPIPFLLIEEQMPKGIYKVDDIDTIKRGEFNYYSSYLNILGKERIKRKYKISCDYRGVYYIQNINISFGDIFGLTTQQKEKENFLEIVVYPKLNSIKKFNMASNSLMGENLIKRWIFEDQLYIKGIREYNLNDRLKDIHWNSSLRMNKLMVKNYDFTSNKSVVFIINTQTQKDYLIGNKKENIDKEIEFVASISEMLVKEGIPVGVWTNSDIISYYNSVKSECQLTTNLNFILEFCGRIANNPNVTIDRYINKMKKTMSRETVYIFVTSYIDSVTASTMINLNKKGIVIKLIDLSQNGELTLQGIEKIHLKWEV